MQGWLIKQSIINLYVQLHNNQTGFIYIYPIWRHFYTERRALQSNYTSFQFFHSLGIKPITLPLRAPLLFERHELDFSKNKAFIWNFKKD